MRHLILGTLCLIPFCLSAQAEWAPVGAKWHMNGVYSLDPGNHPLQEYFEVEVTGDTLIDTKVFSKIVYKPYRFGLNRRFYTRQEQDKIYYWATDTMALMYDFGVSVQDTAFLDIPIYANDSTTTPPRTILSFLTLPFTILQVDSVWANGTYLKRILATQSYPYTSPDSIFYYDIDQFEYVETIGSFRRGPIQDDLFFASIGGYSDEWVRCYESDAVSFRTPEFQLWGNLACDFVWIVSNDSWKPSPQFTVGPNPTPASIEVWTDQPHMTLKLRDPLGRLMLSTPLSPEQHLTISLPTDGIYLLTCEHSTGQIHYSQKVIRR